MLDNKRGKMFFKDKNKKEQDSEQGSFENEGDFVPSGMLKGDDDDGYETSKSYEEEQSGSSGQYGGFSANVKEGYGVGVQDYQNKNSDSSRRENSAATVDNGRYQGNLSGGTILSDNPDAIVLEFKKMDAKINSIVDWIKQFYERFSPVADNFGKFRNMQIENEEKLNQALKDSSRAIEIINKIDLEKIKADNKHLVFGTDAIKRDVVNLLGDVNRLNERASVFISTEELLKLNEEVRNRLDQIKSIDSKIRERADNIEKMKMQGIVSLDIKKEIEKSSEILQRTVILAKQNKDAIGNFTFEDYQEKIDTILEVIEKLAQEVSEIKKNMGSIKGEFELMAAKKKSEAIQELQNIGEIPDLPELSSPKNKKFNKNKKNN